MNRETRIGILFIVATTVLIFGYKYLIGQGVFGQSTELYVEYNNVDYLLPSNPIIRNGLEIGTVKNVYLHPEDANKIMVILDIDNNAKVPKGALAVITTTGLTGGKAVELIYDHNCNGNDCANSGDFIRGEVRNFLNSMIGEPEEINTYLDVVKGGVGDILDTLNEKIDTTTEVGKTFYSMQRSIYNLEIITQRLNAILAQSSSALNGTMKNVESLTSNLAENNNKINSILSNTDKVMASLSRADFSKVASSADESLDQVNQVMKTADNAMMQLQSLLQKVDGNSGSLGKIVNDDALYENLLQVSKSISLLTHDIREHPERYRRILAKKTKTKPLREIPK